MELSRVLRALPVGNCGNHAGNAERRHLSVTILPLTRILLSQITPRLLSCRALSDGAGASRSRWDAGTSEAIALAVRAAGEQICLAPPC